MPLTLIITVLNESHTINHLLRSILNQTKLPNEVIIVDAGSTDGTIEKIKRFANQHHQLHLKLDILPGALRSAGRNLAITLAKHEIILATDAGSELHPQWVEEMSRPFEENTHTSTDTPLPRRSRGSPLDRGDNASLKGQRTQVVVGSYRAVVTNPWQAAAAVAAGAEIIFKETKEELTPALSFKKRGRNTPTSANTPSSFRGPLSKGDMKSPLKGANSPSSDEEEVRGSLKSAIPLPSSRSIAFTKSAWKQVGGYPEHLNTAEDLVFAQRLRDLHLSHAYAPNTIVYWYPPATLPKIVRQFFHYAYGDGQAGFASPYAKRYLIKTFGLILLLLAYLLNFINLTLIFLFFAAWFGFQTHRQLHRLPTLTIKLAFVILAPILFLITLIGYWIGASSRWRSGSIAGVNHKFEDKPKPFLDP